MENYMRRFKIEKLEISQFPDSITIKAFQKGIKKDTGLFIELIKTTPCFLDVINEEDKNL